MKKLAFLATFAVALSSLFIPSTVQNLAIADQFGLKAIGECGFVQISWNAVKGADSYWIYRGPGKGKEHTTPLTDFPIRATTFKDDINIDNSQEYCYFVTAVDIGAKEIAKSDEACATPKCEETRREPSCKLVLKYQIDNTVYWVNDDSKGPMETAPIILNSRMFLVIRYVTSEIEDTKLEWVASEKKARIITRKGSTIELWIGKKDAKINGKLTQIDPNNPKVVPVIKDGRTLLPMRFVGENLGATGTDGIKWFESTKTVEIRVDDPVCEKEGLRYPKATQLKGTLFEFSVEYHTSRSQFPEEVSLGLAKSDNKKILRLGKSKRGKASSEDLSQIKTPEAKIEDIQSSFGKAKLYRFRLTLEPGVLHFYKFISKNESLPNEGYLGPISAPLPNSLKLDDVDFKKIGNGETMTIQGFFSSEPYPMLIDDYWKIYERRSNNTKKMLVQLSKGQTLEDGTFVCLEGTTQAKKGIPMLSIKKIVFSQRIVEGTLATQTLLMESMPSRCPNKFAIVFAGALDNAEVHDENDTEYVYERLRVDFVGEALNNYKACFSLGLCKENIYVCFGRGDLEIDQICADDGDGNPFDFDWDDREDRKTMENDAQRWWRGDDGWILKNGTYGSFDTSINQIKQKIDMMPSDVTPEVYIFFMTHGGQGFLATSGANLIYYRDLASQMLKLTENKIASLHSRTKIRVLLDTCHAGSAINNMENNFKSMGMDFIQVNMSCKADELGYGIWPKDRTIPTYEGVGGTYGIPFLESIVSQAKTNADKQADWRVAHEYALQHDVYALGREKENDDGTTYVVYTHPQFWHSSDRSFYYAGPAFNSLEPNNQARADLCLIGADTSNLTFDICNSSVMMNVENFPRATFKIVNKGIRAFRIKNVVFDESGLSKTTLESVISVNTRDNSGCYSASYFDIDLKANESVDLYVCIIHHRLNAQPLGSNGYMAEDGGLPAYIKVPIKITYGCGSEDFVLTAYARLRVRGESYEINYETYSSRAASLKAATLNSWDPVDTEVVVTPRPEGLAENVLAGPANIGDFTMHVKTDLFMTQKEAKVATNFLKSFKLVFNLPNDSVQSCSDDEGWGTVIVVQTPPKLKDKFKLVYPSAATPKAKTISLVITPGALSKDGYNLIVGKHEFLLNILRNKNQDCSSNNETGSILLKLIIEFTNPLVLGN